VTVLVARRGRAHGVQFRGIGKARQVPEGGAGELARGASAPVV
jgi:hypothetical protein